MNDSNLSHLDERGAMRMVDIGGKAPSPRQAVAQGFLIAGETVMQTVLTGQTPKGDVFAAARLAGITAAKRTSELIPLCHAIALSHVAVDIEPLVDRFRITATAAADNKTGVEMEALTAATVAALTLYDMLKVLSHDLTIADVRLIQKSGGKSDFRCDPNALTVVPASGVLSLAQAHETLASGRPQEGHFASVVGARGLTAAVLTVSDRCSAGTMTDTAGPAVAELLRERLGAEIVWTGILPDEPAAIQVRLRALADSGIDLIVTAGGTGCGPRDLTPEATRTVIGREGRELPGLAEAMRHASSRHTPFAALQRGICGVSGQSLIINLPGSRSAAVENLEAIVGAVRHAVELIRQF